LVDRSDVGPPRLDDYDRNPTNFIGIAQTDQRCFNFATLLGSTFADWSAREINEPLLDQTTLLRLTLGNSRPTSPIADNSVVKQTKV
jgi:hypothetical protein